VLGLVKNVHKVVGNKSKRFKCFLRLENNSEVHFFILFDVEILQRYEAF